MGDMVLHGGFGVPIDTLWTLIRNLVNISFIFALIYIGITTIIDSHASHAKSLLISVIVSALLVNFSLFFAKATIDLSNILSDAIYKKMVPDARLANVQTGVSAAFMDRLGIVPLMINSQNQSAQARLQKLMSDEEGGAGFTILYALGASVLMFKLAFAFGIGAFLLIIRFVALIFLMILSPIAFLPEILPGLGKYRSQWWNALISQSFMAPVYLFGLYITLLILQSVPIHTGSEGLANLFPMSTSGAGGAAIGGLAMGGQILLYFIIAIVLIVGITAMAKSMASAGASVAGSAAGWGEKKMKMLISKPMAVGMATGGYLGRQTIGRTAHNLSESARLKKWAAGSGVGGFVARRGIKATRKLEDATFDARHVSGVNNALGVLGVDAGKGTKDGFKSYLHHAEADELKFAKSLNVKATAENNDELKKKKEITDRLEKELEEARQEHRDSVLSKASPQVIAEARGRATAIDSELKRQQKLVKDMTVELGATNQKTYASTVEKGLFKNYSFTPFRTKHDNHHIADHIRDDVKKEKNKTDHDRLLDAVKESAKGGDGHAPAAAHPPAAAPAAPHDPPANTGGDAHAGGGHGH